MEHDFAVENTPGTMNCSYILVATSSVYEEHKISRMSEPQKTPMEEVVVCWLLKNMLCYEGVRS